MKTMKHRGIVVVFCSAIALVVAVISGIGVFARGDGSTASAVSIRGEEYEYATTGVYAFNAERVVAEGVGWDAVTLFIAVPVLLLSLAGVARGSLRARMLAMGVLAYFFYQYLMYSVFWALGPLFPAFVVVYPASAVAIAWIVSTMDVSTLPERVSERMPRRGMAIFSFIMAGLLVLMWAQRIATGLAGDLAGAGLLGQPTLSVQALDLGIVVPIAIATGVTALRRRPIGYLLMPVFAVKGVTMAAAICAMLISAWIVEGTLEVGPFAIFGAATAAAGVLAWRTLAGVQGA